jgi:isopentenyl-diphosphate Delta-isomerase
MVKSAAANKAAAGFLNYIRSMEYVILVDELDNELGLMEKMEAHEKAVLHRAFSVFLFDQSGNMLLQKRAHTKYHSPGLWTNACCSHPRANETNEAAAHRRLAEEMGIDCSLRHSFSFIYKAAFDNGLTEHELDHVFVGEYEGAILPNPDEVAEYEYVSMNVLLQAIQNHPEQYTAWFKIALPQLVEHLAAQDAK